MALIPRVKGYASKYVASPVKKYYVKPEAGGLSHTLAHTTTTLATSAAIGYWHGRVGKDRITWNGVPYYTLAALAAKVGLIGTTVAAGGLLPDTGLLSHLNTAADAAIGATVFAAFVKKGVKDSGRPMMYLDQVLGASGGAVGPRSTVVGEIPRAVGGDYLDEAELMELARSR